jgi:hypothetical protein
MNFHLKTRLPTAHGTARPSGGPLRHALAALLCWLILPTPGLLCLAAANTAEEEAAAKKVALREPEKKALDAFIERLTDSKRKLYEEDMKRRAAEIIEVTGADEAAAKKLAEGFSPAIEAAMEGWGSKAYEWLAPFVGRSTNALREMARWPVEQIAKSPGVKDVTAPDEQAAWLAHVQTTLSPKQWKSWEAKLADDARQLDAKLVEFVQFASENQRPNVEAELDLVVEEIQNTLSLTAERVEQLKTLTARTVNDTMASWQVKAEKLVREMDRDRRDQVLSQGSGIGMAEESGPQRQKIWDQGLKELLSDAERQQLESARSQRLNRRIIASRGALLLLLDEFAALTVEQREQLDPLMQDPAEKLAEQMKRYYNLEPYSVGAVLRDCELDPIKAVLDESQWAGVERLLSPRTRYQPADEVLEKAREAPAPDSPEAIECLLSADLMERHRTSWEERLEEMQLRIGEVDRTVNLSPAQRETLQLAALGAVQDSLQMHRTQLATWLRQSLAGTPPSGLHQRLATLGTAGFGQELPPYATTLWLDSLDRLLTPEQQSRWQQAQQKRETFLRLTQRQLVLSELDHQLSLTPAQVRFFDDRLARLLAKYAVDLDEYNGSRRWHLQAYSMLTPVAGIPETELKAQLTETQLTLWLERSASQVKHYWEGVKRKHDSRKQNAETQSSASGGKTDS